MKHLKVAWVNSDPPKAKTWADRIKAIFRTDYTPTLTIVKKKVRRRQCS